MKLQQVLSYTRRAVDDYRMIQAGDKIAIGISGGKDSLTLLYALHGLKRFYPEPFEIHAVTVDLGFGNQDFDQIKALCEKLEVPYTIVKTEIADIIFEQRKETNPCSLCAKMRKGALNEAMKAVGCNKIAYAHHKDDIIETFLMSLIYEGRIHTFSPVTYLDRMDVTVIRPLMYMKEVDVIGFVKKKRASGCQKSVSGRWLYQARICKTAFGTLKSGKSGRERAYVYRNSKSKFGRMAGILWQKIVITMR